MTDWTTPAFDVLWRTGLAAIPLVLIAAAASRVFPCRPATRHTIWVTVLAWFVISPLLPNAPSVSLSGLGLPAGGAVAVSSGDSRRESSATTPRPIALPSAESAAATRKPPCDATERTRARLNSPLPPGREGWVRGQTRDRQEMSPSCPLCTSKGEGILNREPSAERARLDAEIGGTASGVDNAAAAAGKANHELNRTPPLPRSAARAESPAPDKLARALGPAGPLFRAKRDGHWEPKNYCETWEEGDLVDIPAFHAGSSEQGFSGQESAIRRQASRKGDEAVKVTEPRGRTATPSAVLEPVASPGTASRLFNGWQEWAVGVGAIRDAISGLPALPRSVWLGGTALLLAMGIARVARFQRVVRGGLPAPVAVRGLVEKACKSMALKRIPHILMVEGRVSPMVWCGVNPKLILPTTLWRQLDDLGRRAVVFHELAHVRRRDHRMAWIEALIGCLYWWHPLVWWVRSRLHAEAENCCDAWVTTLLPQTRRAYATALLRTRQYLSESDRPILNVGIGMTTGRARRFARRLTMVMTESVRPRLSISGAALAALIAVGGWIASPAKSSAKDNGEKDGDKTAPSVAVVKAEAAPSGGTIGLAPVIRVAERNERADQAKRLAKLQAELDRLGKKIDRISKALAEQGPKGRGDADDDDADSDDDVKQPPQPPPPSHPGRAPRAPMPPIPPFATAPQAPPTAIPPPCPPVPPLPPAPPAAHGAYGVGPSASGKMMPRLGKSWADVTGEETEWRLYKLSKGKLEAFTELMSRSDVPILVRPHPEGVEIQATERQHRVLDAFLRIIDPAQERSTDGFGTFDVDGDVRGLVGAYARAAASAAGCNKPCAKGCDHNCERCRRSGELKRMAEEIKDRVKAEVKELRVKTKGEVERIREQVREEVERARERLHSHARDARSEARDRHDMIEALEKQSEALAESAESYREQAERMHGRAGAVGERVSEGSVAAAASADAYQAHIEALQRNAEELDRQAEELQSQAEELQNEARAVEVDARGMEEHADDLDERSEAVQEAVESIDDVTPTPELVNSVVALVGGIERMVTQETLEAVQRAVSAVSIAPHADSAAPEENKNKSGSKDEEPTMAASPDDEDPPSAPNNESD